jgi:serine/threonine-protein kinase
MPLQIGDLLSNRYEVVRPIRSGAMGAVYEVKDRHVASKVRAAKEVLDSALQGPHSEYVQTRFAAEMQSLAALSHPGIPQVIDFFQVGAASYIIMDYVQGLNLEDELRQRMCESSHPPVPEGIVRDALEVLDILVYLHQQSPPVLHRDIKPANLIRHAKTRKVYLVDFGLARSHQEGEQQTRVGTPGYCSQEQMAGKAEPRSEIYSLGVTMHHLISGRPPKMLSCDPLHELIPDFDPQLSAIIEKATQLRARERYSTAVELAEELQLWLQHRERPVRAPIVASSPRAAGGRLGANLAYLCGLLVLLGGLSAGVWVGSSGAHGSESSPSPILTPEGESAQPVAILATPTPEPENRIMQPVHNRDYLVPPGLHRRKMATSLPQPPPHVSHAKIRPVVQPRIDDDTGAPSSRAALAIGSFVKLPPLEGYRVDASSLYQIAIESRNGEPNRKLIIDGSQSRESPAQAVAMKLKAQDYTGAGYFVAQHTTDQALVAYRTATQSGFYRFVAVPSAEGSRLFRFHVIFENSTRPGRAVREEMNAMISKIRLKAG